MVSIVMPAKNAVPFLKECIESIINQTYSNWELVVTNDHSTDETFDILTRFSEQDKRIRVINNVGKGIIQALQSAYNLTSGEYITRMDADDIMPPHKLERFVNQLKNHPNAVTTGKIKYIGDNLRDGYKKYELWMNDLVERKSHYQQIYRECVIPSPSWMTTRKVFESIGGFNHNTYPEDYDLTFRMYLHKVPVEPVREVCHIWRDYAERTSRNDDNYSFNSFETLKTAYFKKIDYNPNKTLVLWGAGKKGKKIAKQLQSLQIDFVWACNNHKKIGQNVYDLLLNDIDSVFCDSKKYQTIIAVANPEDQFEIKKQLANLPQVEAFWFC